MCLIKVYCNVLFGGIALFFVFCKNFFNYQKLTFLCKVGCKFLTLPHARTHARCHVSLLTVLLSPRFSVKDCFLNCYSFVHVISLKVPIYLHPLN